jgi:hypothetical protein
MSVEETEKIFAVKEKYLSEIAVDTSKTKSVRNFYTSNLRKMLQIQRERNKKELSFDNTTTIL